MKQIMDLWQILDRYFQTLCKSDGYKHIDGNSKTNSPVKGEKKSDDKIHEPIPILW